jgi:hypothetical protein
MKHMMYIFQIPTCQKYTQLHKNRQLSNFTFNLITSSLSSMLVVGLQASVPSVTCLARNVLKMYVILQSPSQKLK